MQRPNVVFTDQQGETISLLTGKYMSDEKFREETIHNYFNRPMDLSIYLIYALEFIIKRNYDLEFNKGYFSILEQYAGDYLNYQTYRDYDAFMNQWKSDAIFRQSMRRRFEENDIGYLPNAALAAHKIIKISEKSINEGLSQGR